MSDQTWNRISWFFLLTIIPGGLTMAYFGERDQLGIIMESMLMKSLIFIYMAVGVFCAIYSEVRKRNDSGINHFWVTLFTLIICFLFLALTRL